MQKTWAALGLLATVGAPAVFAAPWPEVGLQAHYARWEGDFSSQGAGGRIRWEPLAWLGVEGTLEAVATEDGHTVQVPIGAQLYAPWELVPGFRARALAGVCGMVTHVHGASKYASGADDIAVGFKLGGGLELALGAGWTMFSDLAWQRYYGHSHEVSVWSDAVDGEIHPSDRLTFALGVGFGL